MSEFFVVRNDGEEVGILVAKVTPTASGCVIAALMAKTKEDAGENWSISDAIAALSDNGIEFNWYPSCSYIDL